MSNKEIVQSILEDLGCAKVENVNISFQELGLDSFGVVELFLLIESKTDLTFSDIDIEECKTVQDVLNIMERENREKC